MWTVDTPQAVEDGQCIMCTVDTPKTVEGGYLIMWKVDAPGTVDDETMYHEESGHTRNCGGWDISSRGRCTHQDLCRMGLCIMWTVDIAIPKNMGCLEMPEMITSGVVL